LKLLFDENLSFRLPKSACPPWPDSVHVRDVGLEAATDSQVWDFAATNDFIIVSKDRDMRHRSSLYGHPPKIIWIRTGNCSSKQIEDLILNNLENILIFGIDESAAFMSLSK
jgi:predicted nuclease of predicted toxin-antitoxin system